MITPPRATKKICELFGSDFTNLPVLGLRVNDIFCFDKVK